jgi:hypothetical protein
LVAGKTQTYFPWESWDHPNPNPTIPKVWFHDLIRPDGRPFQDGEALAVRKLAGSQA